MFNPTIQVIAAQPPVLDRPDLSFEGLLKHFPGLTEAEAVCMTGSTAAGWGNTFSDIDLYVFSDRELDLPVDETMETWPGSDPSGVRWHNWMGVYGNARIDLKVWPTDTLGTALKAYLDDEIEFCSMGDFLQDFVYRLSIGIPLKNEKFFQEMKALLDGSSYRRSLARFLKADAENCLTDVAGQLDSKDYMTARVSAGLAAGFVADAALVLSGQLCRRKKWLLRRLESTPQCGISVDEYRTVVLGGLRPGETDADCARRVARWAQAHIVRLEDAFLSTP
ncbi:hypothetical protein K7472_07625 [Streptomyces sp. PTM05]|uniref:Polymerase nucleotidyl transferase domain-containing protein n=1 Tax=Streptantibioticus parmotrematis TaxID=2873249 RepID=A0ABS7QNG0_9ACTN|nr:hypothetical protein [Streptantibioticus parmotrematis]MBY8884713.1 hypothetical protein [Streptantibioticus parmotrematis]